jgi:hypothetical protein
VKVCIEFGAIKITIEPAGMCITVQPTPASDEWQSPLIPLAAARFLAEAIRSVADGEEW